MKRSLILFSTIATLSSLLMAQNATVLHYWDYEAPDPFLDKVGTADSSVTAATSVTITTGIRGDGAMAAPDIVAGDDDWHDIDGTTLFQPGVTPFSFSYWFRIPDDGVSVPRGIFDFSRNGDDGIQSLFIDNSTNPNGEPSMAFRIDHDEGGVTLAFVGLKEGPDWHFVAATFDPTTGLEVHLDGHGVDASATGPATPQPVSMRDVSYIGSFNYTGTSDDKGLNGDIDDFAIYLGVLSEAEINGLFTGTIAPTDIPAPLRPFPLAIKPNSTNPGNYDFEWESKEGKVYDLVSTTDFTTPPDTWPVWNGNANIASGGTNTVLMDIAGGGPARFFAVVEKDPPPLFATDFESDNGGFSATTGAGTPWEHGTPNSKDDGGVANPGGAVTSGNGESSKCWGTNIGNPGSYVDPTTNACLTSPNIDLNGVTGAELRFAQALDLAPGDSAVVRIIDASTGNSITFGDFPLTITDANTSNADWNDAGPYALPAGGEIRIEWCFSGDGADSDDYIGWYLDDVVVSKVAP